MSYEANTDLESDSAPVAKRDSPFGHAVDGLNGLGSLLIFAVMLLMCADVLSRDIINKPIDGVAEMVAYSIIAIVFLQLPSTLRHGRMARADIFIDGFVEKHPRPGHLLNFVYSLTGAIMLAVVFYATYPNFMKAWTGKEFFGVEGVFTAPTWPVMLVVLIGSALTAIQYLMHAIDHLRAASKAAAKAEGKRA